MSRIPDELHGVSSVTNENTTNDNDTGLVALFDPTLDFCRKINIQYKQLNSQIISYLILGHFRSHFFLQGILRFGSKPCVGILTSHVSYSEPGSSDFHGRGIGADFNVSVKYRDFGLSRSANAGTALSGIAFLSRRGQCSAFLGWARALLQDALRLLGAGQKQLRRKSQQRRRNQRRSCLLCLLAGFHLTMHFHNALRT